MYVPGSGPKELNPQATSRSFSASAYVSSCELWACCSRGDACYVSMTMMDSYILGTRSPNKHSLLLVALFMLL